MADANKKEEPKKDEKKSEVKKEETKEPKGQKEPSKENKEPKKEGEKSEKAEKKPKPEKPVTEVPVKSAKANRSAPIDPRTGTRFAPDSARQLAFDIVYKNAKAGKNVKEIREILANTKKDKGDNFNLDIGYLNFVAASHPEMFKVFSNGKIEVVADPKPDAEAAKKMEDEKKEKKEKADKARAERKEKAAKEASDSKEKKSDKEEEKPSKKEKAE